MCAIDKLTNNYIKEIKQNLLCPVRQKKQVLKDIVNSIKDYAENNNITDINDLYAHFGTPEEVAKSYMSQADINDIKRKIKVRRVLIIIIVAALTVVLLCCLKEVQETIPFKQPVLYVSPAMEIPIDEAVSSEEVGHV